MGLRFQDLMNCVHPHCWQEKHLQHLAEVSAEIREQKTGTQQELEQLSQELGNLKQQAGLVQDQLQR